MDNNFYKDWFSVGSPNSKYEKPFKTTTLAKREDIEEITPLELEPGFWCRYANQLRNGNCYTNIESFGNAGYTIRKIEDSKVEGFRLGNNMLLVENYGSWVVYNTANMENIAEDDWLNKCGSYLTADSKFYVIDDLDLLEVSIKKPALKRIIVPHTSDLDFREVASIDDRVIIVAFQSPPDVDEDLMSFGYFQSIHRDAISPPDEELDVCEISGSNTITYFDIYNVFPVYLNNMIIQPLQNRIAVFSPDLEVLHVIDGKFEPYFISAGLNSVLYMAAKVDDSNKILAFKQDGNLVFEIEISGKLGKCICPPLVSKENSIYWVGSGGVAAYNENGEQLWMHRTFDQAEKDIYPLLYNDVLTICGDSKCTAFDKNGETVLSIDNIEGKISTPLIALGNGRYCVGTDNGIYLIHRN